MSRPVRNKIIARVMGSLFAVAAGTVVYHEGTGISKDGLAHPYRDSASVWTVCSGDTYDVVPGRAETPAQCQARLRKSIEEHAQALSGLPERTPDYAVLAAVDFAYHVGVYGAKNSTTFKLLEAGDPAGAAAAIGSWKYITDDSKRGKQGWAKMNGHWRYDCSLPGNTVCSGIWKRRMWQMDTMAGKLGTAEQAKAALPRYDRAYAQGKQWVIPDK
ncbi:putative endolysin [Pantoea phage LIMElight]|uniref:Lysozyme n=1 Tax=Pantoea phage LIMElight TaxID=881915 RepID=E1Y3X3_9CAUD|nr:putative endolysin [Pantoea phage LIMElight]CBW54813.1 putative endolysin [Pantoea phage LIMElight]